MVKVSDGPGQPFTVGVTVIVAVIGPELVFSGTNAGIFPVPDAANPMDG